MIEVLTIRKDSGINESKQSESRKSPIGSLSNWSQSKPQKRGDDSPLSDLFLSISMYENYGTMTLSTCSIIMIIIIWYIYMDIFSFPPNHRNFGSRVFLFYIGEFSSWVSKCLEFGESTARGGSEHCIAKYYDIDHNVLYKYSMLRTSQGHVHWEVKHHPEIFYINFTNTIIIRTKNSTSYSKFP